MLGFVKLSDMQQLTRHAISPLHIEFFQGSWIDIEEYYRQVYINILALPESW